MPHNIMTSHSPAEVLHTELKQIPLLTPGEISPLAMQQWEMACKDFFSANKKVDKKDRVSTILPGLKDMHARDWVATHHNLLGALAFLVFMKEFHMEFLPGGWDNKLHAHICNSQLRSSDSFPKWVNNIHHSNIILRGTSYHFSDDALHLQLDTLLDLDLCIHCKNHNVKELIKSATNNAGEKTPEAHLTSWILELCKLTDEHAQNTKCYLVAAEDLQRQLLLRSEHWIKCQTACIHHLLFHIIL